jgi:ribosomal protein S12 methylthiotransferase accessory factor
MEEIVTRPASARPSDRKNSLPEAIKPLNDGEIGCRLRVANLVRSPKYALDGVVRVVPPEETIRRVLPLQAAIGVTRLADVTGLDRVGIPNFTTVRPREAGYGISYYNGKGVTPEAAKAGALMEALERHTGELCDLPVFLGTRDEMTCSGATVDPSQIIEPHLRRYQPSMSLEWVEGYDLLGDRPTYVPLNAVVCPYEPAGGAVQLYYSHTNGLASGNTIEEALCHAICEVVERDAVALSDADGKLAVAVRKLRADSGLDPRTPDALRVPPQARLIDLETLPARSLGLVRRLQSAGLLVYLRDVTSPVGIATFDCLSIERRLDGRHLTHIGSGSHPDARVAVSRALTEAAQSRIAHIQGGREDLPHIVRTPAPFEPEQIFGDSERLPFAAVASHEHQNVDDDIRFMLERLRGAGLEQVVAVDLTRPELGVPVIRVVIPGAETWSVFFAHGRPARLGPRANQAVSDALAASG